MCRELRTGRSGREMLEHDARADRKLSFLQHRMQRFGGRALQMCNEPRCRKYARETFPRIEFQPARQMFERDRDVKGDGRAVFKCCHDMSVSGV